MLFILFNDDSWSLAEPGIRSLPGGHSLCEQVAKGAVPWRTKPQHSQSHTESAKGQD
jgi:hypothetical protein